MIKSEMSPKDDKQTHGNICCSVRSFFVNFEFFVPAVLHWDRPHHTLSDKVPTSNIGNIGGFYQKIGRKPLLFCDLLLAQTKGVLSAPSNAVNSFKESYL